MRCALLVCGLLALPAYAAEPAPSANEERWRVTPCLVALHAERARKLGGDPAMPTPDPRMTKPGFVHPICMHLALGNHVLENEPSPRPVALDACNRRNRHRPLTVTDRGYLSADELEDGTPTSFSYRMIGTLADGRRLVLTSYWGGGSGVFSNLVALSEPRPGLLAATVVVPGGDRCMGGLTDAEIVGGDTVEVVMDATPMKLVWSIDPQAPERVMGWLGSCMACCMGTVRRRFALDGEASPVLVSATITSIPDEAPNATARCAYDLMNEAAATLPATLDATRARKLAADIVATCKEP